MGVERDDILTFEVDERPGVPLGFRDRLARENGWSRRYADRVYDEYRRFLYLAATGERAVTPSDEVDQAWHLHLTYTRSYWDRLCGEVLGRPLHHGPTTGTAADDAYYRDQYRATLERYREIFGEAPPADVWPSVEDRFRSADRWVRVDASSHLVLRRAPLVAAGAAGAAVLVGTAATARTEGSDVAPVLVGLVVVVAIVVAMVVSIRRASGAGRATGRHGTVARGRRGGDAAAAGVWFGDCGSSYDSDHLSSQHGGHDGGGSDGGGGGCGSSGCGGGSSGCGGGGCGGGGCGS